MTNGDDQLSEEEIQDLARDFKRLERDFKEMQAELEPYTQRLLQNLAGPHLETMLRSPEATLRYLNDADPKLRTAAVELSCGHWNLPLGTVFEKMATSDLDGGVRESALRALGTCYARTKDERIGGLLAAAVRDESSDKETRLTAFTSLLRMHGNLDYSGKSPLVPRSLAEIDWEFVDKYYRT